MDDTKRTAVFLSTCGGTIGDRVHLAGVRANLEKAGHVAVFEAPSWSDADAPARMAKAVASSGATGVVVGGASPLVSARPAWLRLENGDAARIQTANLREQCAWVHQDRKVATEKAQRLLEIAIARARDAVPLHVVQRPVNRRVAVIGAGAEAQAAARNLAAAGLQVLVLPLADGGSPVRPAPRPWGDVPGVEVAPPGTVIALDGSVGAFSLQLETERGARSYAAGAVVCAMDAEAVAAAPPTGLAGVRGVVALDAFEAAVGKDAVCLRLDRGEFPRKLEARRVIDAALAHAKAGGRTTVLFRNLPVFGSTGQARYDEARVHGVQFLRVAGPGPSFASRGGRIVVTVRDSVFPDRMLELAVDRLVLPGDVAAGRSFARLAGLLGQPLDEEGLLGSSNIRHAPVASARRGIFFCGRCHQETDDEESELEAAALAIQAAAALPPSGTIDVVEEIVSVAVGKCASCLTCVRVCPHGAVSLKPGGNSNTPSFREAACFECGICAAACPQEAIRHGSLSREQLEASASSASRPLAGRRPLVVFACRQGALQAADGVGRLGLSLPDETVILDVPCAGRVGEGVILRALVEGAAGVLVLGCHPQNCRSLRGSEAARSRTARVGSLLVSAGLSPTAVRFDAVAANEPARLARLLADAAGAMRRPAEG